MLVSQINLLTFFKFMLYIFYMKQIKQNLFKNVLRPALFCPAVCFVFV